MTSHYFTPVREINENNKIRSSFGIILKKKNLFD